MNKQNDVIRNAEALIGNTPLIEINYLYNNKEGRVFAKAEYYNLSGSIKDRIALRIIKDGYEKGILTPEHTIVEATSGNTGIAFSALGALVGNPVRIYMPDFMSLERIKLMESFGAQVVLVSREEGGFAGSVQKTIEDFNKNLVFLPKQFENRLNVLAHYDTTGKEIVSQLSKIQLVADAAVAGVGTGGTITGIAKAIKEVNSKAVSVGLEPLTSAVMSKSKDINDHRIAGIGDGFIPQIIVDNPCDQVVVVDDGDAINMARALSRDLGLGVGISSGANFIGAVLQNEKMGGKAVVATVFADDNKKYLTTDYAQNQEVKEHHYTNHIVLKCLKVIR